MGGSEPDDRAGDGAEFRTAGVLQRSEDAVESADGAVDADADAGGERDRGVLCQFLFAAVRFRQDAVAEAAAGEEGWPGAVSGDGGLFSEGGEGGGVVEVL